MDETNKIIDDTLEELSQIHVSLDPDPLEYCPERVALKFSLLDKHSQRLTQVELQLTQDIHRMKRKYEEENLVYEAEKYRLMAHDMKVKAEKTKSEREAAAERILSDKKSEIKELEVDISNLGVALLAVQTKRRDLRDTEGRLKNQMKMVQEALRVNGVWKRKDPPKEEASFKSPFPLAEEEDEDIDIENFARS